MYNLVFLLVGAFFIGTPAILTLYNIIFLFVEKKFKEKTTKKVDALIFILGTTFTAILTFLCDFVQWDVQICSCNEQAYTPISIETLPTFLTLSFVAIIAYVLPRFLGERLSPIIAAFCYGGMFLGFGLIIALAVQFSCRIWDYRTIFLLLFPFNYIICSVRLMRNTVAKFSAEIVSREYKNPILRLCSIVLGKSASFMLISFILVIPMLFVIIIILILFGQEPDSAIKMFTETAEWTLSQKIPPPRLDHEGHYLCTVAACGDEKVVKPIRAGRRHNHLIVVNRQLLVANAFEDLIAEKTPVLHKIIRNVYDKIGLPISKHITTKGRSNIVYFIMKPLEWLFVVVLYTFDRNPENRIHKQYLGDFNEKSN
ncbi:MAG: hypothetical protein E7551_01795 [Ruminococcaceae bacterium]|nr:hypothetical protein [Oscillospiraceae bacterium]